MADSSLTIFFSLLLLTEELVRAMKIFNCCRLRRKRDEKSDFKEEENEVSCVTAKNSYQKIQIFIKKPLFK